MDQEHHHLLLLFTLISTTAAAAAACSRRCGDTVVPYPFGFGDGCPILLTCNANSSAIHLSRYSHDLLILNFTSNATFRVQMPPSCDRTVADTLAALYGGNYAISSHTGLFLLGCSSSRKSSNCSVPNEVASTILSYRTPRCVGSNESTVRCAASPNAAARAFLEREEVNMTQCSLMLTAAVYVVEEELQATTPALLLGVAEVGWWLNGTCAGGWARECAASATCVNVTAPGGEAGFRCMCEAGMAGDGFLAGDGCYVAKHCANKKSKGCADTANVPLIVGGVVAGVVVVGLLLLCYVFCGRFAVQRSNHHASRHLLSEAVSSNGVPMYSYHVVARATNSFSHTHRLGTGAYGTVYVGKLLVSSPSLVAIKRLRYRHDDDDDSAVALLINEIKLISSLNHPNLVRLLGCCLEGGEQILIYEFMPNGTLSQHLLGGRDRGCDHRGLTWRARLDIAVGTASAIAYLHAMHPPIFHRDVKSSNILLDRDFCPKLADFGLLRAVCLEASHVSTAPQGTPGYLDPEYHQNFHLSDKSDVYSFGVVLLELITALKVVDFSRSANEVNLASLALDRIGKGKLEEIIDPILIDRIEDWTMKSIQHVSELAFRCLAFQKDVRPCMSDVARELHWIKDFASDSRSGLGPMVGQVGLEVDVEFDGLNAMGKKVVSPMSVQETWVSDQSSSSTNGSMPQFTT